MIDNRHRPALPLAITAPARFGRSRTASLVLVIGILALHCLGLALLVQSTHVATNRAAAPASSVIAFILPRIRDGGGKELSDLPSLAVELGTHFTDLHIEQPQIDFEADRNGAASSAAPTLIGATQVDMSEYVRRASLLPGEGYTVVLRIEVLSTGEPGRIAVVTSSGVRQIDQAAIDYARTRRWNAGQVNGVAQAVWIRWGVRLQA